jgi:hypothetical protein
MLLFSFVGLLLLRLEACKLLELLFQLPPRKPRDEPPAELVDEDLARHGRNQRRRGHGQRFGDNVCPEILASDP